MPKFLVTPRVRISWRGDEVLKDLRKATREGVFAVGKQAEKRAKQLAHVETGAMRDATGIVSPLNKEVYDRRGRWPGPTVEGTIEDVRELKGKFITHLASLVSYAIYEEVVRGHKFLAPAALEATRDWNSVQRRMVRKFVR